MIDVRLASRLLYDSPSDGFDMDLIWDSIWTIDIRLMFQLERVSALISPSLIMRISYGLIWKGGLAG